MKYLLIVTFFILQPTIHSCFGQNLVLENKHDGSLIKVPIGAKLNLKSKEGHQLKGEFIAIKNDSILIKNHIPININDIKNTAIIIPLDSIKIDKIIHSKRSGNIIASSLMAVGGGLMLGSNAVDDDYWDIKGLMLLNGSYILGAAIGYMIFNNLYQNHQLKPYQEGTPFKNYDWDYLIYDEHSEIDSAKLTKNYNYVAKQKQMLVGLGMTDVFNPAYGLDLLYGMHVQKNWRLELMLNSHYNFSGEHLAQFHGLSLSLNRIYKLPDNSFAFLGLGVGAKVSYDRQDFMFMSDDYIQFGFQFRNYSRLSFRFSPISYYLNGPYTYASFTVPILNR